MKINSLAFDIENVEINFFWQVVFLKKSCFFFFVYLLNLQYFVYVFYKKLVFYFDFEFKVQFLNTK